MTLSKQFFWCIPWPLLRTGVGSIEIFVQRGVVLVIIWCKDEVSRMYIIHETGDGCLVGCLRQKFRLSSRMCLAIIGASTIFVRLRHAMLVGWNACVLTMRHCTFSHNCFAGLARKPSHVCLLLLWMLNFFTNSIITLAVSHRWVPLFVALVGGLLAPSWFLSSYLPFGFLVDCLPSTSDHAVSSLSLFWTCF